MNILTYILQFYSTSKKNKFLKIYLYSSTFFLFNNLHLSVSHSGIRSSQTNAACAKEHMWITGEGRGVQK